MNISAGVDADTKVAGEREIGRASIDAAIEPADRGNADILEPVRRPPRKQSPRCSVRDVAGRALGNRIEIVTGAERPAGGR